MRKGYYEDITTFLVKYTFHTRFFLASLSRKSKIAKTIIDKVLFDEDEIYVLPNKKSVNQNNKKTKIETNIEVNASFQKDESEVIPSEILKSVIRESKDIVIMNQCLCRTSANCEDYPQDLGCIFIGPASRKIASKYGKRATVEEALEHVDWAESEGLSHVIGRNKIDTIWMNIGPKEDLLTICHCCPCCCLWKVIPDLDEDISSRIHRLEDVQVNTIEENCINCMKCLGDDICFADAISLKDDKITIDQSKCVGCGHCVKNCKFDAIELNYSQKSVDSVLNRIGELVNYKN